MSFRHNIPLYLDAAADVALCDPHDLGHLVNRISCQLNLAPLPEFNNSLALDRFLRTSHLLSDSDKIEEIIGQGKFLLDCATKWSLSTGRHPLPLVTAAATLAAQANGVTTISVDDFAAEMGAVVSTSWVRYKELVQTLAHAARVLVPWGADVTSKNVVQNAPLLIRLMELRSKSDKSDEFLENLVVDTDSCFDGIDFPASEEEAKYFKIDERMIRNGEGDEELENVKLSWECLSSSYQNVRERINHLKNDGAMERGTRKKRSDAGRFEMDSWVNKLDERRWKCRQKMTADKIFDIDVGFDAPPPSFVNGLELRESRRERIKAAKCRINKVKMGSTTLEEVNIVEGPVCREAEKEVNLVEEPVCREKEKKLKRKRKGAINGVDWEDCIIELLLLHGVSEAEIEEGHYKRLLDIHVFG